MSDDVTTNHSHTNWGIRWTVQVKKVLREQLSWNFFFLRLSIYSSLMLLLIQMAIHTSPFKSWPSSSWVCMYMSFSQSICFLSFSLSSPFSFSVTSSGTTFPGMKLSSINHSIIIIFFSSSLCLFHKQQLLTPLSNILKFTQTRSKSTLSLLNKQNCDSI